MSYCAHFPYTAKLDKYYVGKSQFQIEIITKGILHMALRMTRCHAPPEFFFIILFIIRRQKTFQFPVAKNFERREVE
jgi:hypothetical protein